jgi:hypothetical protein
MVILVLLKNHMSATALPERWRHMLHRLASVSAG